MKHKRLIGFSLLVLIVLVSIYTLFVFIQNQNPRVIGTVTEVNYKPNLAEDGSYNFTVSKNDGNIVFINATGLMNVPSPGPSNTQCVEIPIVKEGQNVSFKLPKGKFGKANSYSSCYDGETENPSYYFTVLR